MKQQILEAEVKALRTEIANLNAQIGVLRGLLELARKEPPRPLPELPLYGYDVPDIVAAIRHRGVHVSETGWLADLIEALDHDAKRAEERA